MPIYQNLLENANVWTPVQTFTAGITPLTSNGAALGTTALQWSDLFLATGAVINWDNGDATLTHAANTLTFAGAASGYVFDSKILIGDAPTLASLKLSCCASDATAVIATFQNTNNATGRKLMEMGVGPNSSDTTSSFIRFLDQGGNTVQGNITRNGSGAVAYGTSSDIRGKPNRERLSLDQARSTVDAMCIWDFDKDGNSLRGIGVIAQEAWEVHRSFAHKPEDPDEWWSSEKAASVPFLIANVQLLNRENSELRLLIAKLEARIATLEKSA